MMIGESTNKPGGSETGAPKPMPPTPRTKEELDRLFALDQISEAEYEAGLKALAESAEAPEASEPKEAKLDPAEAVNIAYRFAERIRRGEKVPEEELKAFRARVREMKNFEDFRASVGKIFLEGEISLPEERVEAPSEELPPEEVKKRKEARHQFGLELLKILFGERDALLVENIGILADATDLRVSHPGVSTAALAYQRFLDRKGEFLRMLSDAEQSSRARKILEAARKIRNFLMAAASPETKQRIVKKEKIAESLALLRELEREWLRPRTVEEIDAEIRQLRNDQRELWWILGHAYRTFREEKKVLIDQLTEFKKKLEAELKRTAEIEVDLNEVLDEAKEPKIIDQYPEEIRKEIQRLSADYQNRKERTTELLNLRFTKMIPSVISDILRREEQIRELERERIIVKIVNRKMQILEKKHAAGKIDDKTYEEHRETLVGLAMGENPEEKLQVAYALDILSEDEFRRLQSLFSRPETGNREVPEISTAEEAGKISK